MAYIVTYFWLTPKLFMHNIKIWEKVLMDIEINDYEILDRANQFRDAADILK